MLFDSCALIMRMKIAIAAFLVLVGGIFAAKAAHSQVGKATPECTPIFKGEWTQLAGTQDQSADSLTACENGELIAFHTFTAPAFGSTPSEVTKWDYSGQLSKDVLPELRQILLRSDISQLSEEVTVKVAPGQTPAGTMRFAIIREGKQQNVTLTRFSYLSCAEKHPVMPEPAWDLFCLFSELYESARSGTAPSDEPCGCKSLHAMAAAKP